MKAFYIPNLNTDCSYGYQIVLNLSQGRVSTNRGIQQNLNLYIIDDQKDTNSKIVNLIDAESKEGYLNFYFLRFTDGSCHLFGLGKSNNEEVSETCFTGKYEGYADVIGQLTKKLNDSVEKGADRFQQLYRIRDVEGIKKLVRKIINSIK
jgi:hypothetical protein